LRRLFGVAEMVYLMKYMLLSTSLLLVAAPVLAAADAYTLTIENHAFVPKEIKVPAGSCGCWL
jgi:hypothetical protein